MLLMLIVSATLKGAAVDDCAITTGPRQHHRPQAASCGIVLDYALYSGDRGHGRDASRWWNANRGQAGAVRRAGASDGPPGHHGHATGRLRARCR